MSLVNTSHRLDLEERRDGKLTQTQRPVKRYTLPLLCNTCSCHTVLIKQKTKIKKFSFTLRQNTYLSTSCLKILVGDKNSCLS